MSAQAGLSDITACCDRAGGGIEWHLVVSRAEPTAVLKLGGRGRDQDGKVGFMAGMGHVKALASGL